jgi:TRAP-type transport system periplasmic protein
MQGEEKMKTALSAFAFLLALIGSATAQDKAVELKFSTWLPPQHGMHDAVKPWIESVAAKSNNTIKLTLYPAQQLGKADDHYDMARDGIADITYIAVGYQAGRLPIAVAANVPFMMSNADGGSRGFDEWYRQYAAREMKDVRFCLAFVHDPGTLHGKKKITRPEELKGMKIRSAHSTMADFVTLLGGTNVRVSAPEARSALESGVADAITFPWKSILLFGIDKVVTHSMDSNFYVSGFSWVMNKDKYDGMSARQRAVMDEHCSTDWAGRVGKIWGDYEAAGRAELKAKPGHTVYPLSADDVAAWRKAAEPIRKQWMDGARKAGLSSPDQALAEFEAILKKHGAAFN